MTTGLQTGSGELARIAEDAYLFGFPIVLMEVTRRITTNVPAGLLLLGVDTLLLCSGLTDVCVHYTFADGHQHDYSCRVIEDCVAGSSEEAHEASLRAMEYLQTGARCELSSALDAMDSFRQQSVAAA